jgi:hypothetical protein
MSIHDNHLIRLVDRYIETAEVGTADDVVGMCSNNARLFLAVDGYNYGYLVAIREARPVEQWLECDPLGVYICTYPPFGMFVRFCI